MKKWTAANHICVGGGLVIGASRRCKKCNAYRSRKRRLGLATKRQVVSKVPDDVVKLLAESLGIVKNNDKGDKKENGSKDVGGVLDQVGMDKSKEPNILDT